MLPGLVAPACNPSTQKDRGKEMISNSAASLGYTVNSKHKTNYSGAECNGTHLQFSTQETRQEDSGKVRLAWSTQQIPRQGTE